MYVYLYTAGIREMGGKAAKLAMNAIKLRNDIQRYI